MIHITLIIGPMFSSKSTKLIELLSEHEAINRKTLLINHTLDTRCDINEIKTHNQGIKKCLKINKLTKLMETDKFKKAQIIGIDEAQFFDDLYEFILKIEKTDKIIYIAGLNGCSDRKNFNDIIKIIPLADNIIHMTAYCGICKDGTKGIFSKRICKNKKKYV